MRALWVSGPGRNRMQVWGPILLPLGTEEVYPGPFNPAVGIGTGSSSDSSYNSGSEWNRSRYGETKETLFCMFYTIHVFCIF